MVCSPFAADREWLWDQWTQWTVARWRPSEALSLDDPVLAVDLDRAVSLFGRHVEGEMEEAARQVQDKWQRATSGKGKSKRKAPTRSDYRDAADRAWKLHVRRVMVFGPFTAAKAGEHDMNRLASDVTYTIEKDLDRLTGNPAVDRDPWQGERRMIWSDGRVEHYDAAGMRTE